jgi:hypothetical protein
VPCDIAGLQRGSCGTDGDCSARRAADGRRSDGVVWSSVLSLGGLRGRRLQCQDCARTVAIICDELELVWREWRDHRSAREGGGRGRRGGARRREQERAYFWAGRGKRRGGREGGRGSSGASSSGASATGPSGGASARAFGVAFCRGVLANGAFASTLCWWRHWRGGRRWARFFTEGIGDAHQPVKLGPGHEGGDEGFLDYRIDVTVCELKKRNELGQGDRVGGRERSRESKVAVEVR